MAELQLRIESITQADSVMLQELSQAKTELKQFEQRKTRGWYKRAKIKWAVEGDLPSKFFYSKLKQSRRRNFIPPLPDDSRELQQELG